jgi:hypothetical protein
MTESVRGALVIQTLDDRELAFSPFRIRPTFSRKTNGSTGEPVKPLIKKEKWWAHQDSNLGPAD